MSRSTTGARRYSVSGCNEYDRCPQRYRYGYIDRLPHDRPTPAAWRHGVAVHAALEAAYRACAAGTPLPETIPIALAALDTAWRSEGLPDDPAWRERSGAMVHRTLTRDPLRVAAVLGVEQRFDAVTAGDHRFGGVADLVLQRDDHTIEIIDHKVSRTPRSAENLHRDRQLNLYGWFARLRWPWASRVLATHHYPPLGATVTVELDDPTMTTVVGELDTIASRTTADTEFRPRPGPECETCPWITRCPAHSADPI